MEGRCDAICQYRAVLSTGLVSWLSTYIILTMGGMWRMEHGAVQLRRLWLLPVAQHDSTHLLALFA
jgi:hypothetical protein